MFFVAPPALPPPPALSASYAPAPSAALPAASSALRPGEDRGRRGRREPPPDPAFFDAGEVEIKIRAGFTGQSWSALSLFTSFIGWTELQLVADVGVLEAGDFTLGVGAEAHYARTWLVELVVRLVGALSNQDIRWRMHDYGVAGRVTAHYALFDGIDTYGLFLAGPTWSGLDVSIDTDALTGQGSYRSGGMRLGAGAGASVVSQGGLVAGAELRYIAGMRFREAADVSLVNPASGEEVEVFEMSGYQAPPRGFSWMLYAGYRF